MPPPRLSFYTDASYPGQGVSTGIPRGLMVTLGGLPLVREGMGIGAVLLRDGRGTYLPSAAETLCLAEGKAVTRTIINRRLVKALGGRANEALTFLCERASDLYMRFPRAQRALLSLRNATAGRAFQNISVPSSLEAGVITEYLWGSGDVRVECVVSCPADWRGRICVLNELAADVLDSAAMDGGPQPLPSGWVELPLKAPIPVLVSSAQGLRMSVADFQETSGRPVRLFWGRERGPGLNWAGYCIGTEHTGPGSGRATLSYRLSLTI